MEVVLIMNENHVTCEMFLLELFGNFGRNLGNPKQFFTDNPNDMFKFIEDNAKMHLPSFINSILTQRVI